MDATPSPFDDLQAELDQHGADAALERLARHLATSQQFHELFDVRLMQARLRLGLPVVATQPLDELAAPLRSQMEDASLTACREVGNRLLEAGRLREAWMYLRPLGEKQEMAAALQRLADDESLTEQLIEIALNEGVAPRLGFELILKQYGICNAITTFDAEMHGQPRRQRQEVAALLVRHLHAELAANVRAEIRREQGSEPVEQTVAALVADRDWLFASDNYHVDTSHLAAVVRFAEVLEDRDSLELAVDLTEYGRRLSPQYQYAGQAPFADVYASHGLFFRAQLGQQVDEALAFFRHEAEQQEGSTLPAEVYVALLDRLGRTDEALEAAARWLPPPARASGFAPSLLELALRSGRYERLMEVCRQRGDVLGFAAGLVAGKCAAGQPQG